MCLQKTLDIPEGTALVSNRKVPTASQAPEAVFVAVGSHSLNKWSSVRWTQTNSVGTIPKLSHEALAMSLSLPTAEGCLHAGACRCPCPSAGRHLLGAAHLCNKMPCPLLLPAIVFLFVCFFNLPPAIHNSHSPAIHYAAALKPCLFSRDTMAKCSALQCCTLTPGSTFKSRGSNDFLKYIWKC